MYDLAGKFFIRKGVVDSIEESVETAESNRVHAFRFGRSVVLIEFGEEDLLKLRSTPSELSF